MSHHRKASPSSSSSNCYCRLQRRWWWWWLWKLWWSKLISVFLSVYIYEWEMNGWWSKRKREREKKKIYNDEKVSKEEIFHWNKIIILHMDGYINDVFLTIFFLEAIYLILFVSFLFIRCLCLLLFFSLSLNYINGNKQIIIYIALQKQQQRKKFEPK